MSEKLDNCTCSWADMMVVGGVKEEVYLRGSRQVDIQQPGLIELAHTEARFQAEPRTTLITSIWGLSNSNSDR